MSKLAEDTPSNQKIENDESDEATREQNKNNNNECETGKRDHPGAKSKQKKIKFNIPGSVTPGYDHADVENEDNESDGSDIAVRNYNVAMSVRHNFENDESDSVSTDQDVTESPQHKNESEESGCAMTDRDYTDSDQHSHGSDESHDDDHRDDHDEVITKQDKNECNIYDSDKTDHGGADSNTKKIDNDNFEKATKHDTPNSSIKEITGTRTPLTVKISNPDVGGTSCNEMIAAHGYDAAEVQIQAHKMKSVDSKTTSFVPYKKFKKS